MRPFGAGILPPDALASLSLADVTNSFSFPHSGNGNPRLQPEPRGGEKRGNRDNQENNPPNRNMGNKLHYRWLIFY
jgi:hypothetical protein